MWLGWNEYRAKAAEVNRHIAWYTRPYPWSCKVVLMPGCRASLRRSAPMYWKWQHIRGALRRCAIELHIYFFYSTLLVASTTWQPLHFHSFQGQTLVLVLVWSVWVSSSTLSSSSRLTTFTWRRIVGGTWCGRGTSGWRRDQSGGCQATNCEHDSSSPVIHVIIIIITIIISIVILFFIIFIIHQQLNQHTLPQFSEVTACQCKGTAFLTQPWTVLD